jgi:hypothetical protein
MLTFQIIDTSYNNELIVTEKAEAIMKKITMKGLERVIKNNCYKIKEIKETSDTITIYVM